MAPEQDQGPADAERLFAALLAGIGGPERALLVGELWERCPSRELLRSFTRDVFGVCVQPPAGEPTGPAPRGPPDRRCLRSRLVFVLFRLSSVQSPAERRRLREILRDVRQRSRGPVPAVVGVVVLPPEPSAAAEPALGAAEPASAVLGAAEPHSTTLGAAEPHSTSLGAAEAALDAADPLLTSAPLGTAEPLVGAAELPAAPQGAAEPLLASAPLGAPEPLLLVLLSSVFLPGSPAPPPQESPLHTALYRPGDPRTALGVKRAACRALRAVDTRTDVDTENEQKVSTLLKCFPWRRRREDCSLKSGKNISGEIPQHPGEGIALKALCELANGDCEESHTDT